MEAWVRAQQLDPSFDEFFQTVEDAARKVDLWIQAFPGRTPTIIVPLACQELLLRDAHTRMHHLNHAKVFALLKQSYFFPNMKQLTRKWLEDCPECELNKTRQNTAHALFYSALVHAPRARWCMDFQGQGTDRNLSGETEVLSLIDSTSRYVIVIPLKDRQAFTFLLLKRQMCCTRTTHPSSCRNLWNFLQKPPTSQPLSDITPGEMPPLKSGGVSGTVACACSRTSSICAGRTSLSALLLSTTRPPMRVSTSSPPSPFTTGQRPATRSLLPSSNRPPSRWSRSSRSPPTSPRQ
jgi:hypothetical protein